MNGVKMMLVDHSGTPRRMSWRDVATGKNQSEASGRCGSEPGSRLVASESFRGADTVGALPAAGVLQVNQFDPL